MKVSLLLRLKEIIRKDKAFGFVLLLLSFLILSPKNLTALFYYDDNPIRYMVAKRIVYGNLDKEEFFSFWSFGSADIYIPFFFLAKIFNLEKYDELIYNIASLFYFALSIILTIFYLSRVAGKNQLENYESENLSGFPYILVVLCILGIASVVGGRLHWILSCSLFTVVMYKATISEKFDIVDYIILGIAHFISPTLLFFSAIFSFVLKRPDIFLFPLILYFAKIFSVNFILFKYIKLFVSGAIVREDFMVEDKIFLPVDYNIITRVLSFGYFNYSFVFLPLVYIVALRSVFTKKKTLIFACFFYYLIVVFSAVLLKLWEIGWNIPKIFVIFSVIIFGPDPTRFIPLFLISFLLHIDKTKFDDYFKFIALFFFLVRALLSVFGSSPLPKNFPESVKSTIEYILNNTKEGEKILVEGDKHIFQRGKLIHPLYNSHIIPYIIAKVENRKFLGSGVPWGPFSSPFIAEKFKEKPIDKSEILSFISENDIKYVLCWTQECENFFRNLGKKIIIIDKFKIVHLYED